MADRDWTKINIQKHYSFKLADAIVCLIAGFRELEVPCPGGSKSHFAQYGFDVVLYAWDNCREQGYYFTLDRLNDRDSVTVRFGSQRVCPEAPVVWVGPTQHGWDGFERHSPGTVTRAAEFIVEVIEKYLRGDEDDRLRPEPSYNSVAEQRRG